MKYLSVLAIISAVMTLALIGCSTKSANTEAMSEITVSVMYREKIMLPPGTTLTVMLEDVSRMDAPATVLASESMGISTAPPFQVTLKYDASTLDERHRYGIRARIENEGKLIFINTEHIDPFGGQTGQPVQAIVRRVGK